MNKKVLNSDEEAIRTILENNAKLISKHLEATNWKENFIKSIFHSSKLPLEEDE